MSQFALSPNQLTTHLSPEDLSFKSLSELEPCVDFLGQERAKQAIQFGLSTSRRGYNIFVMGDNGTGRISLVMRYLESKAQVSDAQPDWIYVNNFDEPREPWAVQLPAGYAKKIVDDCQKMVGQLMVTIPAAFENPSFQRKKTAVEKSFNQQFDKAIDDLENEANKRNFALYQDDSNISFTPLVDGKPIDDVAFAGLPQEQRDEINKMIDELEDMLNEALLEMPQWKRESFEKVQELNSNTIHSASKPVIKELEIKYKGLTGIQIYFKNLREHLVKVLLENFNLLESPELKNNNHLRELLQHSFVPNPLISNNPSLGAPVVYEAHPTFPNLFGRVEYWHEGGAITTSHEYIRGGALHKANGGYLVLEAEKMFEDPYIWGQLKRTFQTQELKLEPPMMEGQTAVTIGLNPHGIPLNVKIILVGNREHYYLLQEHDSEFSELFRVLVDFNEHVERNDDNILKLARLINTHAESEGFLPVTISAFVELVKFSSRLCAHQRKLTSRFGELLELLGEADVICLQNGHTQITAENIVSAQEAREFRHSRIRNEMLLDVVEGQILIATDKRVVGSINGLTVWEIGSTDFGTPARITATVVPGNKGIVDIERESELGLSIHSKGVFILSGYLANRYATQFPLTISANIVMEQSYGFIDGDSASLAELCALISAITQTPIKQSLAVTGSINQFGEVQAIGGVNEKIEGFFELCLARGLTGDQGVIIPKANQIHLMLKHKVIQAIEEGLFHIYVVEKVDEALEILCLDNESQLKEFHLLVNKRLQYLHDICENIDDEEEEPEKELEKEQEVKKMKEIEQKNNLNPSK